MPQITVTPSASPNSGTQGTTLLRVENVEKLFGSKGNITRALDGVTFDVAKSEFVAIMGPSGSGKTTLLNCISTIDKPTTGTISIDGSSISDLKSRSLAKFRRDRLGFIFQDSNLLDTLTGFENIALGLTIKRTKPTEITDRVARISSMLGVTESLGKYPNQMSGGQRQRIAAARAIVGDPSLILADEPTGALDSRNATIMLEALEVLNTSMGATILMVTHDAFAASYSRRVLFMKDGRLFSEVRRGAQAREEYFSRIMEVVSFLGGQSNAS